AVDEPKTFHDVHLAGMRRPVIVDERLIVQSNRVDDQRVTLVMAHRFAIPGWRWMRRMFYIQIDAAYPVVIMPDHPDFLGSLDEIQLARVEQKSGDTGRPASHFAIEHRFAGKHRVVDFPQLRDNPGLQNWVRQVRNTKRWRYAPRTGDLIADVRVRLV